MAQLVTLPLHTANLHRRRYTLCNATCHHDTLPLYAYHTAFLEAYRRMQVIAYVMPNCRYVIIA
jgi:hypothetical protein